ncbi:MAG TPA: hypothetical protein VKA26_05440 [Ignavibacteriaceae bacterium]|nr:hypothetical protein [Ignavibacteriaceae bacterium]
MTYKFIKSIAIAGNILFVLWILFNGINEGFKGTVYAVISYLGLILLLSLNTILHFKIKT